MYTFDNPVGNLIWGLYNKTFYSRNGCRIVLS